MSILSILNITSIGKPPKKESIVELHPSEELELSKNFKETKGVMSMGATSMMDYNESSNVDYKDMNAFIGKGSEFSGKLTFDGTVKIDGKVDGQIFSKGTLIIGQGAMIKAEINVSSVIISGNVEGNITAQKSVELRAPGRLKGNIKSPSLVIQKGVIFQGSCQMEGLDKEFSEEDKSAMPKLTEEHVEVTTPFRLKDIKL